MFLKLLLHHQYNTTTPLRRVDVAAAGGAAPLQQADLTGIAPTLHDPLANGQLFEQADSGGFIHGPSLNHAVAAAVLRVPYPFRP